MPKRRAAAESRRLPQSQAETRTPGAEPRGARRKRETRESLLRAAYQLIAERGADAVAIHEITEAADVGFGSFYNHFESKDAIHAAVLRLVLDGFGAALDRLTQDVEDPALKLAISARHTLVTAAQDPLWGQLLLREWSRPESFSLGLGLRLLRDVGMGIAAKRFKVSDPLMGLVVAGGTIVSAVGVQLGLRGEGALLIEQAGLSAVDLDKRATITLLQALGVPPAEARKIVSRALPPLDWKPSDPTRASY